MASKHVGSQDEPRPFVAVLGTDETDTTATDVFPSTILLHPDWDMHLPDYDIVVSYGVPVSGATGPVVIFGDASEQELGVPEAAALKPLDPKTGVTILSEWVAIRWSIPRRKAIRSHVSAPDPWAALVRETIAASEAEHWSEMGSLTAHRFVEFTQDERYGAPEVVATDEVTALSLVPLFNLSDETVVAALSHTAEGHPILLLPDWTPNKRAWLRMAWQVWVDQAVLVAPPPPGGYEESTWMTASELRINQQIKTAQRELATTTERISAQLRSLEEQMQSAATMAELGPRRLLTATGDELVEAVQEAFESFGFSVTDMDKLLEDKREDLRIHDGDGWTALAEVKGYGGGGKTNDFFRFGKFLSHYLQEPNHAQNKNCWYIVNSFREQAPSARPGPFRSSQIDVASFAENFNGLVVPTEELFKLTRDVELLRVAPEEARAALVGTTGTFVWAPSNPVDPRPVGS